MMKSNRIELFAALGRKLTALGHKQCKHGSHRGLKTSLAAAWLIREAGGTATREELVLGLNTWVTGNTDKNGTEIIRGKVLYPGATEWVEVGPEYEVSTWRHFEYLFNTHSCLGNVGRDRDSVGQTVESYYMGEAWRPHFYYRSGRGQYSLTRLGEQRTATL